MTIEFKTTKDIDPQQLNNLFTSIGWKGRSPKIWKSVLDKSSFVVSAWKENELIGFGRILEDGVMCMFYDIGVLPGHHGEGIGTKIMEMLIEQVKDKNYASIGLFMWDKNMGIKKFYEKFGFEEVATGMELVKYMKRE